MLVDRLRRTAETSATPVADLYEYEALAVAHYEVYFSEPAAEIARDQLEPAITEEAQGLALLRLA